MDIPDRWEVQVEGELLHTGPPDGSIYLGFWALDPDITGDQVGAAAEEIVSSMVRNYTIEEEDNFESNGIPFYYFQGSGWEREGGGPAPLRGGDVQSERPQRLRGLLLRRPAGRGAP
jgi:hypothetical protein